jgi:branched-chain amino acid transport system ATP-binding protein
VSAATPTLEAHGVTVQFEGLRALDGVDLTVAQGEILGLIGPNGAGKTTLVNVLSGFQRASSGRVSMSGRDLTRRSVNGRARAGLARTFQNVRLFTDLTVLENVEAAAIGVGIAPGRARPIAWRLLERLGLEGAATLPAGSLPYGDERRLGIARALAIGPTFLLLDEPAAGLNEAESSELVAILAGIREQLGCGLMIIEHDMAVIMRLCDRLQVLDYGCTIALGAPEETRRDPAVLAAYLGTDWEVDGAGG